MITLENKKILNSAGFTLLEIIISIAIFSGIMLVVTDGFSFLNKAVNTTKLGSESKDIVNEMISSLSTSASTLQVDYSSTPAFPTNLPIAWDTSGERELLSDCIKIVNPCHLRGRMGVIVTPTDNKRLFLLKIRLEHPDWKNERISTHLLGYE